MRAMGVSFTAGLVLGLLAGSVASPWAREDSRRVRNHLAGEKSLYLEQHADDPVNWYPWGDAAFERARREGKPIFLSIGYSSCHWCHVMERESFENDSVAALLNRGFISVKVDREERPDVDRVYMGAMQAMGLGGGWPLTVFLTPELEPFFGGTYFPPDAKPGQPGLRQLLPRIEQAWAGERTKLERAGAEVMSHLAGLSSPDSGSADRARLLEQAYVHLQRTHDAEWGGFGDAPGHAPGHAPKFPSTSTLAFLLRYWARDPERRGPARDMVLRQLDAMRAGGIHDALGGGFHRYATDREWRVPHFEKLLPDQAQLACAYLEACQVSPSPPSAKYAETARRILDYVSRELTSSDGAFCSAEDAESEGEEGRFYVWRASELDTVLGERDAALFRFHYGVTAEGNFARGASVLHERHGVEVTAAEFGLRVDQAVERLANARTRLLAARSQRIHPRRDDKVLTAWNGLMISAYARGARVLGDASYARRAERAAEFVWSHHFDARTRSLERRSRQGESAVAGQLDDYAFLAQGFIDLYGASHEPRWLSRAVLLTDSMIERFWDERDGAFFDSPANQPDVKVRFKGASDATEPAGNSAAMSNLQRLGLLLDRADWLDKARRGFDHFARRLRERPEDMPGMLAAMVLEQSVPRQVVIAGGSGDADTRRLIHEFDRRFLPQDLLVVVPSDRSRRELVRLAPFVAPLRRLNGKATAYVCVNHACRLPTTDPKTFARELDGPPPSPPRGATDRSP